jgi:hypothetical protein
METKTLSQFLCDYFKDSDQILVNAVWLQKKITESVNNERVMKQKIKELELQNDRINIKNESLKANIMIVELENHAVYKLDIKG